MQLTIIGCGDAFGSGGRFHSCYLLDCAAGRLMIDCGANSPLALKRAGVALSGVGAIVISHCHGDHFGGLPFLYLDRLFLDPAPAPLVIMGPPGIEVRMAALMDCVYPGILDVPRGFDLVFRELMPGVPVDWRGLSIAPLEVRHFSGSPSLALRFSDGGRSFAFSGDSGWCSTILEAGRGAALYLIESTTFDTKLSEHLDYLTLATKFDDIGASRYLITHMSEEMLRARDQVDKERCLLAEDGLMITI
jgi:ribonuclease BN (tRNA processing enzyme)